jgi:hypothetical protein
MVHVPHEEQFNDGDDDIDDDPMTIHQHPGGPPVSLEIPLRVLK